MNERARDTVVLYRMRVVYYVHVCTSSRSKGTNLEFELYVST